MMVEEERNAEKWKEKTHSAVAEHKKYTDKTFYRARVFEYFKAERNRI